MIPSRLLSLAAAVTTLTSTFCAGVQWRNSTDGIHAFLTFDSGASTAAIASAHANQIDYVWGSSPEQVPRWRSSKNPDVVLSMYVPYTRDPTPHVTPGANSSEPTGLPWWQNNMPSLVLYQCDRKTPAWECFAGEGCAHVSVPLDLTNPATLEYQTKVAFAPAAKIGYNAIALDNYGLSNSWGACGAFKGPNGSWVQIYDAANPKTDPRYTSDVLDWTRRAVTNIHRLGMLVIPNFSEQTFSSSVLEVANLTDGLLAEVGFTIWNPVPNTTSFSTPPPYTTPEKFEEQVLFIRNLQRYGKGFFAINEWGAGPDYHLNPSKIPYNITGPEHHGVRQFVVASFMMVNGGSCGIFLTCIQCYGGDAGGLGNFSIWPEYLAPVGHPAQIEPVKNDTTGVWSRLYSSGLTIVNPGTSPKEFQLPTGKNYEDLYGNAINGTSIDIDEATGLVLLLKA